MDLPPTLLFYGSLFILILLEGIALYMIFSYFRLLKSYDSIMRKQRELEQNVHVRSDQLLKAAQQQAQTVIDQANAKAQTIVQQAEVFNQATQEKINVALERFLQQELSIYQQLFTGVREETVKQLSGMSQGVAKEAVDEIGRATKAFALAMADAQTKAQAQLETAYKQAENEVATYKAQRVKQLNQLTTRFVQEAAQRFFKKALTRDQQETLIMEALDEAQREKLF